MYYCDCCGFVFEEPKIYRESHGFSYGPYEESAICPHCRSGNFSKMRED